MTKSGKSEYGFTVIEILVVVLIIGILSAITVVAYVGIQEKAIAATMESDLDNGSKQIKIYQVLNKNYPTSVNDCPNPAAENICLEFSPGSSLVSYDPDNDARPRTFSLTIRNEEKGLKYTITNDTTPTKVNDIVCPAGFIIVPGSITYGTSDFCVMKYEAKNVGGVATSQSALTPWVDISQTSAITAAAEVCASCHLITEAEWMTLAQNILSDTRNWNGGVVGTNYTYIGHSDNSPTGALAVSNINDGYSDTDNTSGDQRRTLILSNDETIWDLAGNVWEWTSGQTTGGQPGITGEIGWEWKEWNATPMTTGTLTVNPFPSGTGITGAGTWNAYTNNIGLLYSYVGDTSLRGFFRGGYWTLGGDAGVLTLNLRFSPDSTGSHLGFRVTSSGI